MFTSDLKDEKPKEQEKRGDFLHRPFSKKPDKNAPAHKQPSASLITQIQNTKALLKDRKAPKAGFPDKGGSARAAGWTRWVSRCVVAAYPSWVAVWVPGRTRFLCPWEGREHTKGT